MPLVVCDTKQPMTLDAAQHRSGKGAGDENFPVASWLVAPPYRRPIMAFYEFVRIADDIADHPTLSETDKLGHLDRLEASLLGRDDHNAAGIVLRAALAERNLSPQHAQDLLKAFRQDVTKHRYADWDELIDYCRYSAMPVGRFVLDVHGESRSRHWRPRARPRNCLPACTGLRTAPASCWNRAACCRHRSTTGGCRWRFPLSSPWRGISCSCCGPGTR